MPDTLFLLQKDRNWWPVSLAAPFQESCDEANWLANGYSNLVVVSTTE